MRNASIITQAGDAGSMARAILVVAAIGHWTICRCRSLIALLCAALALGLRGCRPKIWRRTIRREFFHQFHLMGTRALPFISICGVVVGVGLVFQALYWLDMFGQSNFVGKFLVLVLVREIAPVAVGLITIVRSVSVMMVQLGTMQVNGQIRMLDAQGIDPVIFLILPRVFALSLCTFCLTIVFLIVALGAGFLAGNALLDTNNTFFEYINRVLAAMGPQEFAIIPLKTMLIGYMSALIGCLAGFETTGSSADVSVILPGGMAKAVMATLVISVLITLIL